MSKIELGFFCLPKNKIPEFTPLETQDIIFPDYEIIDIDIQKTKPSHPHPTWHMGNKLNEQ